jgi:hypothetical protein
MISIPLYIPHTLFGWNFGNETCAFWLITDYLLCTASVNNIVLISYDRYPSVSKAVSQNVNLFSLEHYMVIKPGSLRKKKEHFVCMPWIELRDLQMVSMLSTTELHLHPPKKDPHLLLSGRKFSSGLSCMICVNHFPMTLKWNDIKENRVVRSGILKPLVGWIYMISTVGLSVSLHRQVET